MEDKKIFNPLKEENFIQNNESNETGNQNEYKIYEVLEKESDDKRREEIMRKHLTEEKISFEKFKEKFIHYIQLKNPKYQWIKGEEELQMIYEVFKKEKNKEDYFRKNILNKTEIFIDKFIVHHIDSIKNNKDYIDVSKNLLSF